MAQIKDPEVYIEEYESMFGELPPDVGIRQSPNERIRLVMEAIDSGIPMAPAPVLDDRIDY